jgi:Asp-tRNA(Asn)/Glu-tRNA(Gln) amidotransferase A subunit family amidase
MRSRRRQRGRDVTPPDPGGEWRLLGPPAAPRLDAGDVIASPTLCLTPPLMSEVADADSLWVNRRIVRNTVAVNYLGLCAITMPVGCDRAGMPVGLELTASAEGRCAMILPLRALFFDGAGKLIGSRAARRNNRSVGVLTA